MPENWKKLVKKYANGRQICNCGNAYLSNTGIAYIDDPASPTGYKRITDYPCCEGGCSANMISAREYIATRILAG